LASPSIRSLAAGLDLLVQPFGDFRFHPSHGATTKGYGLKHEAKQKLYGNLPVLMRVPMERSLFHLSCLGEASLSRSHYMPHKECLDVVVRNRTKAIVLDFFSGSGTTAHALMLLNRQDGGCRQCISVTNNEVADNERKALNKQGLRPGNPDREQHGICQYITLPRLKAAITRKTPDGEPIKGDYKFNDAFPMAKGLPANLEYFRLDFLDKDHIALGRQFREILPILWAAS